MCTGCPCDEVDVSHLEELPEDELSSPVTVYECGGDLLLGELLDGLGDVGSLDCDCVLDSCLEESDDIGPSLDDDDGLGVPDIGSCRAAVLSVGGDLIDLDALPEGLGDVGSGSLGLLHEVCEELLGPLDDEFPLGHTDILDTEDLDSCLAGTDTVDGLQCGSEDRGLDLIETGGNVDDTFGLSALGSDIDLDAADPSGLLEVPEVQVVTEQTLGLTEDGPDDVGLLDYSVGCELCFDKVFHCIRIDTVHCDFP